MARRITQQEPKMAILSTEKMEYSIIRLKKLINEIQAFDISIIQKRWGAEVQALETSIEGTLTSVFGHSTVEYNRYKDAINLDNGPITTNFSPTWGVRGGNLYHDDAKEAQQYISEGKERSTKILQEAVKWLQDELEAQVHVSLSIPAEIKTKVQSRKIFIVHGHENSVREAVARFIEKIGFQAIILHEQANQGRTVMEKVEAHGDVSFAIVLLTPDDTGCKAGDTPKPRARQNVLLELGYFIGRLGRTKICAFATTDTMELPTDFAGIVWEPYNESGGWRHTLCRELQAAGFEIDWNKVMNP